MKKIFLLIALVCFISFASATMELEPFTKEDFNERMNTALFYNKQVAFSMLPSGVSEEERAQVEQKMMEDFQSLEELKKQAVTEYNEFFDAYYVNDLDKVNSQTEELKVIFDEMNSLMSTKTKFTEIYNHVLYWGVKLDYKIKEGIIDPNDTNTADKTIPAIKEKTGFDNPVPDVNDGQYPLEPQGDLLIPIAVSLIIIVLGVVYAIFIRKN